MKLASKHKGLKICKFPKSKIASNTKFIETLVWILERARLGEVRGYSMVFILDENNRTKVIEANCELEDDHDKLLLLGGMRRMEHLYMERAYNAPTDTNS